MFYFEWNTFKDFILQIKVLVSILTTDDDEKVNFSNENYFLFKKLSEQHNIPLSSIITIYSSLYKLFRLSIKSSSIKQEVFFIFILCLKFLNKLSNIFDEDNERRSYWTIEVNIYLK